MNRITIAFFAFFTCLASPAWAAAHEHDGWYVRLGIGGGVGVATLASASSGDSSGFGGAVASELAVGHTIRPGLVLGLGTYPMIVAWPKYDGVDAGGQHISGTGVFVDRYSDPQGGWHTQVGLLGTAGFLDGGAGRKAATGFGYGAMAAFGRDMFVTDEWSIGAQLRVCAYRLFGVDDVMRLASPSLLLTATWH